jgi:hypothetical protein
MKRRCGLRVQYPLYEKHPPGHQKGLVNEHRGRIPRLFLSPA